jgi:hypothetical protein
MLLVGCKREPPEGAGTTTLTSAAARASIESAIDRIAAAHCERDVECEKVRMRDQPRSLEVCRGVVKSELTQKLDADACPRGVDSTKVARCVAAITGAGCLNPVGDLTEIEDCRPSRLCL